MTLTLTGAGPTASFAPTAIAGLAAWFDATKITGKVDGNALAQWDDSSGNARHATQVTGAAQPLYKTNILNGQPVVRFDGVDDALATASLAHPTPTVFIVGMFRGAHGASARIFGFTTTASIFDNSGPWAWFQNQAAAVQPIGGNSGAFTVVTARVASAAAMDMWLNGAGNVAFDPGDAVTTASALALGNEIVGGTQYGAVDIAEFLLYDTALSTADRQTVERYLGSKYGIAVA